MSDLGDYKRWQADQKRARAGLCSPAPSGSVFEIVDSSSDETYWTCGIFLTLAAAIAALEECGEPHDLGGDHSDFDDDYAKVEVRERKVGWSGAGKVVHTQEWERNYDEPTDDYSWKKKPNPTPHQTAHGQPQEDSQ